VTLALVLILSSLAGARTWRLLAVDTAGEPARKWMRRITFKLLAQGKEREADLIEEGWECRLQLCRGPAQRVA
jgi:hypothetical protein